MACICCSVKVVSRYMGAIVPACFVTRNRTLTGKMLDCKTLLAVSGFGKGGMLWETGYPLAHRVADTEGRRFGKGPIRCSDG
jgi:hypothetical protein